MDTTVVKSASFETISTTRIAREKLYHSKPLRVMRDVITKHLTTVARERGIQIIFNQRFSHIVSEQVESGGITFAFTNGKQETASLLVAADGIWSRVRGDPEFIDLNLPPPFPFYAGQTLFTWVMPEDSLRSPMSQPSPSEYRGTAFILLTPLGAVVFVPEDLGSSPSGPEDSTKTTTRIGITRPLPDRSFSEWRTLAKDKPSQLTALQHGHDELPDLVKSAIDFVSSEYQNGDSAFSVLVWPHYNLPLSSNWISKGGRAVTLGDAAHATAPTGGTGAGLACEDAIVLAGKLQRVRKGEMGVAQALAEWERERKERVKRVIEWTREVGMARAKGAGDVLGKKDKDKDEDTDESGESDGMEWLYGWTYKD